MRRPLIYSLLLHVLVVSVIAVGLPSLREPLPVAEEPIVVELVSVAERSNPPPATRPAPEPELAKPAAPRPQPDPDARPPEPVARPEPKPELDAKPEPPRPEPARPEPARPEPPKPEKAELRPAPPKPEVARTEPPKPEPPKPAEEAKPQPAKPAPKPEPERKPEPAKPAESAAARPPPKPEPPRTQAAKAEPAKPAPKSEPADDFAAVQRTVQDLKKQAPPAQASKPVAPAPPQPSKAPADGDFGREVAQALRTAAPPGNKPSLPVTSSEVDAVRRQIERCWNVPAGAKEADDLVVSIRVEMNIDGTPRSATVEGGRGASGPSYQAAAESARRAVLNPRCHPFKLPPEKFERWRTMTLVFNPKEMAGT